MKSFPTLLFPFLATIALADPPNPAPKPVQLPVGIRMERDIAYVPEGDEAQRLDLYLPEATTEKSLPLIVHMKFHKI